MVITLILSIIIIGVIVFLYCKKINFLKNVQSFDDSLLLTGFPIIPIKINNTTCNMIIDTGSEHSFLDKNKALELNISKKDKDSYTHVWGSTGKNKQSKEFKPFKTEITFECKNKEFTSKFVINDFKGALNTASKESGILIHGLLGSDFFDNNDFIIDYKDHIFYKK